MDFEAIWQGMLFGSVMALSVGPVFFALIQASVLHGFRAGLTMAIGVVVCDTLFVALAVAGSQSFLAAPVTQYWTGSVGGILLLIFGLKQLSTKTVRIGGGEYDLAEPLRVPTRAGFLLRGGYLNALNPFVFIFWSGTASTVSAFPGYGTSQVVWFFVGTLLIVFATDTGKVALAKRLRNYVTPRAIMWMNRVAGAALFLFGIKLLVDILFLKKLSV
jgi:threonine/homoserine/homoserine lactone efflux protein